MVGSLGIVAVGRWWDSVQGDGGLGSKRVGDGIVFKEVEELYRRGLVVE
jgi:hypothetical protein